jgi:hypothetical protein
MTVVFKDPPPKSSPRRARDEFTIWKSLLKPLMAKRRAGKWAMVREYDTPSAAATAAYDIRSGRNQGLPEGRWDAVSRDCELYVRFVGE